MRTTAQSKQSAAPERGSAAGSLRAAETQAGNRETDRLLNNTPDPQQEQTRAQTLLVGDKETPQQGQMQKSEFLSSLRDAVCTTTDAALKGTPYESQECPWVDHWFSYYASRDAAQCEQAILRYAPEARGATDAAQYIAVVTSRVMQSVSKWAKTGEVSGIPEGVPTTQPGGDQLDSFGGMFFKAKPGGARSADPVSVRQQLGQGSPLPGGVRSRMESAFGSSFSGVRLHTDATGAQLSESLNARAFTVGEHVAFGSGEFQPGTIAGDALIAHELAHVVQQGGATEVAGKSPNGDAELESDADRSATGAVTSLWAGMPGRIAPAIRSGLRLQRCRHDKEPDKTPEIEATADALGEHAVSCMIKANEGPHTKTSGIWYASSYKASFPDDWDPDYVNGYANPDYWERVGSKQWRLKKERSASAGVKAWLKGLTIAECYSTAIVSEVDAMRAAIGDAKFDELYGSEDKTVVPRLELGIEGSNALDDTLKHLDKPSDTAKVGTVGNRPAQVGQWAYFTNHPMYLLKHPGGSYQGENAMLRADKSPDGEQLWEGLGQAKVTEKQMYANMMADYNRARNEWDNKKLDSIRAGNGGTLPKEYDPAGGVFPDKLNSYQEILDAPPYTINGKERKGGYKPSSGKVLDPKAVKKLRDSK